MSTIHDQFEERFADGARTLSARKTYRSPEKWIEKGKLNFKRTVLGLCGLKTTKSIDELAEILTDLKMVKPTEDANEVAKGLSKMGRIFYNPYAASYLKLHKVHYEGEPEACHIKTCFDWGSGVF